MTQPLSGNPIAVAQTFDRANRNHRKIFTRVKGGFTYLEVTMALGIIILAALIIGYNPLVLFIPYFWGGYKFVMWKRRIKTDYREFEDWVHDLVKHHRRRHPLRSRRYVSGKSYHLPAKVNLVGTVEIPERGE